MKIISKKSKVHFGKRQEADHTVLNEAVTRVTRQRTLILDIIQRARRHLNADEIYRQARLRRSGLGLSTVYRTLRVLTKLGLVEEIYIDGTRRYYERKQAAEHHHLVCLSCGRVIEFHYPLARRIRKSIHQAKDFAIVNTEVRVTGYCSQCRESRE